jgi:hypothetical protein
MLRSAEQAVDLDARAVRPGKQRYVAHATPPDPAGSRSGRACLCLDDRQGNLPAFAWVAG